MEHCTKEICHVTVVVVVGHRPQHLEVPPFDQRLASTGTLMLHMPFERKALRPITHADRCMLTQAEVLQRNPSTVQTTGRSFFLCWLRQKKTTALPKALCLRGTCNVHPQLTVHCVVTCKHRI